jgi:hypothetical protein
MTQPVPSSYPLTGLQSPALGNLKFLATSTEL